jgi:LacI family transcriptional regulator
MKKRVTVIDVAKKAGVSQTTVSRVLNNHHQIKEMTKKKVLKAIDELGFSPNQIARSMVMKKTKTIGFIVGDISNPLYAETAKVVIGKARQKNYDVIITETDYEYGNFEKNIQTLVDKSVDGILIASIHQKDTIVHRLFNSGFPIVYFNRKPDNESIHHVTLDNEKGVYLAVKHLVDLGHDRIAFLSYPSRYPTFHERYLGYLSAVEVLGLEIDPSLVYDGELLHENIFNFVSAALSRENPPTSFVTTTDQQAISVMDSVSRLGFRVPEQISVVGFDDIDISSHPYIQLTTVSLPKRKMASLALENLISLIEGEQISGSSIQVTLDPKLVIRKTSGLANVKITK